VVSPARGSGVHLQSQGPVIGRILPDLPSLSILRPGSDRFEYRFFAVIDVEPLLPMGHVPLPCAFTRAHGGRYSYGPDGPGQPCPLPNKLLLPHALQRIDDAAALAAGSDGDSAELAADRGCAANRTCECESVGIGLLAPLGLYLLARRVSRRKKALELLLYIPLGTWGLWAFAYYLGQKFGEPLAFAKVQIHWQITPTPPLGEKIASLATLAPIREFFDSTRQFHWRGTISWWDAPFSLFLANPLYFLLFAGLTIVGAWKRWLDRYELALAGALILIPYSVHSYEMHMVSTGRFVALAFPVYCVMGRLLAHLPLALSSAILGLCSCFLGIYSALFVRWFWIV
jgi:hypothetical protein